MPLPTSSRDTVPPALAQTGLFLVGGPKSRGRNAVDGSASQLI